MKTWTAFKLKDQRYTNKFEKILQAILQGTLKYITLEERRRLMNK